MPQTKEDFKQLVADIESQSWYKKPIGFGIAKVDKGQINQDKILQATFPVVNWNENFASAAVFLNALKQSGEDVDTSKSELVFKITDDFLTSCIEAFRPYIPEAKDNAHKNVQVISTLASLPIESGLTGEDYRVVFIFEDKEPESIEVIYLKLYVISSEKAEKHSLNLIDASEKLQTCAWLGNQPIELDWLRSNEILLKLSGKYPTIEMIDKYPKFLQHIIPADAKIIENRSKLRLGE